MLDPDVTDPDHRNDPESTTTEPASIQEIREQIEVQLLLTIETSILRYQHVALFKSL